MACPQVGLIRGLLLSGLCHLCPAHRTPQAGAASASGRPSGRRGGGGGGGGCSLGSAGSESGWGSWPPASEPSPAGHWGKGRLGPQTLPRTPRPSLLPVLPRPQPWTRRGRSRGRSDGRAEAHPEAPPLPPARMDREQLLKGAKAGTALASAKTDTESEKTLPA